MEKMNAKWLAETRTYMPLMKKAEIASRCAERCLEEVRITTEGRAAGETPPMYRENVQKKARYLMGILLRWYLRLDFDGAEGDEWLLSANEYDKWAGDHLMNQIERMKGEGGESRNRAFDLLGDFREMEKRVNSEIYADLQIMNDPVARFAMACTSAMTPEAVTRMAEEAEKLKTMVSNIKSETK